MKNILHKIVTEMLKSVFVCLPAEVVKYDPDAVNATIKPLQDNLPENYEVPILFTGAQNCRMTWPLKAGDKGILIFSSRDIDTVTDDSEEPEFTMENYNDALFIPTILFSENAAADPDTISIEFGDTSLKMWPDKIDIKTGTVNIEATETKITGNLNVGTGVSGIAAPTSIVTFVNGIATSILN